jgi:hypothetical protein
MKGDDCSKSIRTTEKGIGGAVEAGIGKARRRHGCFVVVNSSRVIHCTSNETDEFRLPHHRPSVKSPPDVVEAVS